MAAEYVGYARLVEDEGLATLPLAQIAEIDGAVRGRQLAERGGQRVLRFEPRYRPERTVRGQLQFALRYEGVDLQVLALLFERIGPAAVQTWIAEQPTSIYARRAGFLYEWLTQAALPACDTGRGGYVPALDSRLQFAREAGERNAKYRVIDNLPGTRDFCPLVRRTPYVDRMLARKLHDRAAQALGRYPPDLLRRAAAFLYLKETQSSFEVEREQPSPSRAQRFADLLREASAAIPLSEDRFVELQNAIVDARFREGGYRTSQNWIGDDLGYRKRVAFVPPRPEDVPSLMAGLVAYAERQRRAPSALDAVAAAASLAFGFVFIHPFLDGNGRLHRYLIHQSLVTSGFTPPDIVLPVSATILADTSRYVDALEAFARPLVARTEYVPGEAPARGNEAVYYRYFDATAQTEYLYQALERTIEHDLTREIEFLLGFDRAKRALAKLADWPAHSADLFIRVARQNEGRLSATKRASHFAWMTDEEVASAEAAVAAAFEGLAMRDNPPDPSQALRS